MGEIGQDRVDVGITLEERQIHKLANRPILSDTQAKLGLAPYTTDADLEGDRIKENLRIATQGAIAQHLLKRFAKDFGITEHALILALGGNAGSAIGRLISFGSIRFKKWFEGLCNKNKLTFGEFLKTYFDNPQGAFAATVVNMGGNPDDHYEKIKAAFFREFPVEGIEAVTEGAAIHVQPESVPGNSEPEIQA